MVCQECNGDGFVMTHYLYASCASSQYITDKMFEEECPECLGIGEVNDDSDYDLEQSA